MSKIIGQEINALIQNYLYEKLGEGAQFTVQYNEDNIHVWVKIDKSNLESGKES